MFTIYPYLLLSRHIRIGVIRYYLKDVDLLRYVDRSHEAFPSLFDVDHERISKIEDYIVDSNVITTRGTQNPRKLVYLLSGLTLFL